MNTTTSEERLGAVLAHTSSLIATLLSASFLSFVGPLVIWFIYKDKSAFARRAAAGAFNFNVLLWVLNIVAWILFVTVIGIPIAIILWIACGLGFLVHIWAAFQASKGEQFKYPVTLPILN